MKEFTIDRSRWLRGDVFDTPSQMRDRQGRMCCLGFYAESCGAKAMTGKACPSDLKDLPEEASWLVVKHDYRSVQDVFTEANDASCESEKNREKKIKQLFAERGVKVKFVGRTPKRG
jgi:hypothetical protein